jgi:hypothetical protein
VQDIIFFSPSLVVGLKDVTGRERKKRVWLSLKKMLLTWLKTSKAMT